MNKIEEIFRAWVSAANPNKIQKKIAEDRFSICNQCEFKRGIENKKWSYTCGICKCPLSKKIFTPVPNGCPKLFWYDVDKKNGLIHDNKSTKTLF